MSHAKLRSPIFLTLLLAALLVPLSSASGEAGLGDGYFNWKVVAVDAGVLKGRAWAGLGNVVFGIGGLDSEGHPTRRVEIFETLSDGTVRKHEAELSSPLAFAGAASYSSGEIYVAGGTDSKGPSTRVFSLEWKSGQLIEADLEPLPAPRVSPGVAVHRLASRYFLYVMGGAASVSDPVPLDSVFELALQGGGTKWSSVPALPQGGRIAPMCAEVFNEVVASGGYARDGDGRLSPSRETAGYSRVARDGQTEPGWRHRPPAPVAFTDAAFGRTGDSSLVFLGGRSDAGNGGGFPRIAGGAAGLDTIFSYNAVTETWTSIGRLGVPAVGGVLQPIAGNDALWIGAVTAEGRSAGGAMLSFLRSSKHMVFVDYAMLVAYFVFVLLLGFWFAGRQKSTSEYALGGGRVKWWALAMSLVASGISTISFMAVPALVACMGFSANSAGLIAIPLATLIGAYVTYPLLRRLRITSTFAYLEQRYGLCLRLFGSFQSMAVLVFARIGLVIMLPALAVSSMAGIDPVVSVLAIGLVTTIYSGMGGFEAVVWTDFYQGILLFLGFVLIAVLAFVEVPGGMQGVINTLGSLDRGRVFLTRFDLSTAMVWFALVGAILTAMSFAGDQTTAQRVLATPMRDMRKLAYFYGGASLFVTLLSAAVGICLLAFFRSHPELLSPVMKNDEMVPLFLIHKVPPGITGILLATLFAAGMSTISASINSVGVLMAEDFGKRLMPGLGDRGELWLMRGGTILSGLFGTGVALWLLEMPMPTLLEAFTRIMALVGGGFAGIFILGMFTRRTHELGAILGGISSFVAAYFLQFAEWNVHWSGLNMVIVGVCLVVGYVSSLLIPWKRKDLAGLTVWDQVKEQVTDEQLLAAQSGEAEVAG